MEEIRFRDIQPLYDELVKDFDMTREQTYKHLINLELISPSKKDILEVGRRKKELLETYNTKIKRSCQFMALVNEQQELEQRFLRARDFGFLDAYRQNINYINQDANEVISRMTRLDSINYPYQEKFSIPFSYRKTNYIAKKYEEMNGEEMKRGRVN